MTTGTSRTTRLGAMTAVPVLGGLGALLQVPQVPRRVYPVENFRARHDQYAACDFRSRLLMTFQVIESRGQF